MSLVHTATLETQMDVMRLVRNLQRAPLKDEKGRNLLVVIHRISEQKAPLKQKGLFYAWAKILSDHVGCSLEEMKRDLKAEFLPMAETVNRITGEITLQRKSTEALDWQEWNDLLTQMEALAIDHFGIILPPPKDKLAWAAYKQATAA